jgi:hypothetical protein
VGGAVDVEEGEREGGTGARGLRGREALVVGVGRRAGAAGGVREKEEGGEEHEDVGGEVDGTGGGAEHGLGEREERDDNVDDGRREHSRTALIGVVGNAGNRKCVRDYKNAGGGWKNTGGV